MTAMRSRNPILAGTGFGLAGQVWCIARGPSAPLSNLLVPRVR